MATFSRKYKLFNLDPSLLRLCLVQLNLTEIDLSELVFTEKNLFVC